MKLLILILFISILNFLTSAHDDNRNYSKEIISKCSNTTTLNKSQYENLLTKLHLKSDDTTSSWSRVKEILNVNSDETQINSQQIYDICPFLLNHLINSASTNNNDSSEISHDKVEVTRSSSSSVSVWIYGTIAITGISLCGLAGVIVIPIVDKHFYFYVLQFFMALAVGTLTGDSLMHLLPHSMAPTSDEILSNDELHHLFMQRGIATMLGIIGFWMVENILKYITQRNSNFSSDSNDPNEVKRLEGDIIKHEHGHSHGNFNTKSKSLSSIVWMVVLGDGLHNFTDGMTIGAAFSNSIAGGFSTTVAVFCHELPHELGDFAVLLKAGMPAKQAIFYNILSSILSFLGMIMGIWFGDTPETSRWVFAIAAGLFIYIALVDMIPELSLTHKKGGVTFLLVSLQFAGMMSGFVCMLLISIYEHELESLFV